MPRAKKVATYKEVSESPVTDTNELSNNPMIHFKKPKITFFGGLYESGRITLYEDEYQFNILQVNELDVLYEDNEKSERIVGIIDTMHGVTDDNGVVLKKECPFEFWISVIKGKEKEAISKGWTTKDELKQYFLPRSYRMKYKQNDILFYSNITYICRCTGTCKCTQIPRFFKVKIKKAVRPKYMGELDPPYYCYVFGNYPNIGKYLWCHEASLYEDEPPVNQPYEEIEDILYSFIIRCHAYKQHCMLIESKIPRWVNIESLYYNQKEILLQDSAKIALSSEYNILFKDEHQQQIEFLLNKTFAVFVRPSVLSKKVKIRATTKNLMKHGMCMSPYRFDFVFKYYFQSLNAQFKFEKLDIEIGINIDQIKEIRKDKLCILKGEDDDSVVDLSDEIILKLNRKAHCLYVSNFTFTSKNRHVIVIEEEEKYDQIDEDEIMAEITEDDVY